MGPRRALVREVNPHLICVLCQGYFIEATTITECLHSFCRSCLIKYLENSKFCPICDVQLHKNNPLLSVRCDPILQQLVYKMIPGLYAKEMARRRKYYSELGGGPCSSGSDSEETFPPADQYFSPEDSISLSLEFHVSGNGHEETETPVNGQDSLTDKQGLHRRYLQCPAAVNMSHLKKFLKMKYDLSPDQKVDIMYEGEVLPDTFSLMDVAYSFNWNKDSPMRFKYRILQRTKVKRIVPTQKIPVKPVVQQNKTVETKKESPTGQTTTNSRSNHSGNFLGQMSVTVRAAKESSPVSEEDKDVKEIIDIKSKPSDNKVEKAKASDKIKPSDIKVKPSETKPKPVESKVNTIDIKAKPVEPKKQVNETKVKLEVKPKVEKENGHGKRPLSESDTDSQDSIEPEIKKPKIEVTPSPKHEPVSEPIDLDDRDYSEDIQEEDEEDDEERLHIVSTQSEEEKSMDCEEVVPVFHEKERRREKKKKSKGKHHHRRHHERKRESPPAVSIMASEGDLMKLKVKLTAIKTNDKVQYSVVEDFEEKKEPPKVNGTSKSPVEKPVEVVVKPVEEPPLIIEKVKEKEEKPIETLNNNKPGFVPKKMPELTTKEKLMQIRAMKQKQMMNGTSPTPEPIKMPPSSITVSKITAEEKRQMEQQKLLQSQELNDESKKPSLEIMLVNGPPTKNTLGAVDTSKPPEVKKTIRPTPPSIPLSRLHKNRVMAAVNPIRATPKEDQKSCRDDSGALDLSGKSSRKSPEGPTRTPPPLCRPTETMRNLMTLSDTAVQLRNIMQSKQSSPSSLTQQHIKIPNIPNLVKAPPRKPNPSVRQIPNPSMVYRQYAVTTPRPIPQGIPLSSAMVPLSSNIRKMENMTRNIEKVAAGLSVKAAVEAAYGAK